MLHELLYLLRRLIGENIELKMVHGRDLGLAKVDQGQLEQVIINLAVNARDAMIEGGTLTIRTSNVSQAAAVRRGHEVMPAGNYVLIEVSDTGVGIPKTNLERIFEPFFSTKEVGSGTGLGLSTVYGIVKQTGGFIFVDSEPGHGAVFKIYLPRHYAAEGALTAPAEAEAAEVLPVKDLTGIGTVLLVEDDPVLGRGLVVNLESEGYQAHWAQDLKSANTINERNQLNLVLLDLGLPDGSGLQLMQHLRARHGMSGIALSGYGMEIDIQRSREAGFSHHLIKPITPTGSRRQFCRC